MQKLKKTILINLFLLLLAIIVSYAAYKAVGQALNFRQEIKNGDKKIQLLLEKKKELEDKIDELKTTEALERSAKERLNLKKPGENVVVVIPENKKGGVDFEANGTWDKIKKFFSRKW